MRFNGFPEIKESLISGYLPATFMLAPMAMALREQGVPLKIVYLGHRDGTALMVQKASSIWSVRDLKGMGSKHYQTDGGRASGPGFGLAIHPDALDKPFHWKMPRRVFVRMKPVFA